MEAMAKLKEENMRFDKVIDNTQLMCVCVLNSDGWIVIGRRNV